MGYPLRLLKKNIPSATTITGLSTGLNNFLQPDQQTNLSPVTNPALKQQLEQQQQAQVSQQHQEAQRISDNLKQARDIYNTVHTPEEIQAMDAAQTTPNKDRLRANTPEEVAQEKAMDGTLGKVIKSTEYIGSQALHGGTQVLKGGAWVLNHLNTSLSDTQLIPDTAFSGIDKAADLGITPGQKAAIEDTKTLGMGAARTLGMLANIAPAAVGGEYTELPKTIFALQGFGQGQETMDAVDPEHKLNPTVRDMFIAGMGGTNGLIMGDFKENVLSKPVQEKIVSAIAADALKETAEKGLSEDAYKETLKKTTDAFTDKAHQILNTYAEKTGQAAKDFSALQAANYVLKKGVDVSSDHPVFNANLGQLMSDVSDVVTKQAPLFGGIGAMLGGAKADPTELQKSNLSDQIQKLTDTPADGIIAEKEKAVRLKDLNKQLDEVVANQYDQQKDRASGKKITYSKGTGEETGKFFKTVDGKKEEIEESRYKLEKPDDQPAQNKPATEERVPAAPPESVPTAADEELTNNQITNPQSNEKVDEKNGEQQVGQESRQKGNEEVIPAQEEKVSEGAENAPLQKAIDAVTHGIVVPEKIMGRDPSARFDFGMTTADKQKAVSDIKKGNYETAPAKKMLSKLQEWDAKGEYPIIEGLGGESKRVKYATSKDIQENIDDAKANKIGELSDRQIAEINKPLSELGFTHQDAVDYENYRQATEPNTRTVASDENAVQQPKTNGTAGKPQSTGDKTTQASEPKITADAVQEQKTGTVGVRDETTIRKGVGEQDQPKELAQQGEKNKVADQAKILVDKIRSLKSDKNILHGGLQGVATAVYDGALETAATVIEQGGKLVDAIQAAIDHIKTNSDEKDEDKIKAAITKDLTDAGISDHENNEPTGIRNADVAAERGKEVKRDVVTKPEIEAEGKRLVDSKELDPDELAKEVIRDKKAITAQEQAALLYHKTKLKNRQRAILKDENPENVSENQIEYAKNVDLIDLNQQATEISGNVTGRALGFRTDTMNEDFSMNSVLRRAKLANNGEELSPKDKAELEKRTKRIEELEGKLADREEALKKAHENSLVDKVNRSAHLEERQAKREVTKAVLRKEREGLLTELHLIAKKSRSEVGANKIPVEMIAPLTKLARNYVLDGVNTLSGVVDKVYNDLKDHLDDLQKSDIADIVKDNFDKYLAEQNLVRLERSKARQKTKLEDLKQQNATGNFEKKTYAKIQVDADYLRIRADINREQTLINKKIDDIQNSTKSWNRKAVDFAVKYGRQAKLASVTVLGKLAATGLTTMGIKGVTEGVGAVYSKILPRIAKKSTVEGGFNVKDLAQSYAKAATAGMKDAYDELNIKAGGQSDLSALYGKYLATKLPAEAADFFGHLHSAIKAPIKRFAWEYSYGKRVAKGIQQGIDVQDPVIDATNRLNAYKDAEKAIFMGDNKISQLYEANMRTLENSSSSTARTVAALSRILLPFVKVPTNIVLSTGRYAFGLIPGAAKLAQIGTSSALRAIGAESMAKVIHSGMGELTPEESDMVLRNLKHGTVGGAALLLGFFHPKNVGGFYQPGEKRKHSEVNAGALKIFGHKIPAFLTEHPIFQAMQIGATFRRFLDAHRHQQGNVSAATLATASGLAKGIPLANEANNLLDILNSKNDHKLNTFIAKTVKGEIEPGVINQVAQAMDTKNGSPVTLDPENMVQRAADKKHGLLKETKQELEIGIPVLRKNVPRKH